MSRYQNSSVGIREQQLMRKLKVTLEAFQELATFSFQSGYEASQYSTNTLFITLCWNRKSRSISVAPLIHNHITWIGNALVVDMPKHKGD